MSATGTHTQTTTFTTVAGRKRTLSLSLLGKQAPSLLHDLPAEIIIHILKLALLNDRPKTLALISRIIKQFVNAIIYRTVVLDTLPTVALFHRTATSPRSSYLLSHVKRLSITWEPEYFTSSNTQQLRQIVAGCTSLHMLATPSCCQISASPSVTLHHDGLTELTVQSFADLCYCNSSKRLPNYFSASLTHLRICEPGNTWQSPLSIIEALGHAPNLTHLQLARRADSNQENDVVFADNIAELLSRRKGLKMVVVSVFSGLMGVSVTPVQESSIWMLISQIQETDPRAVVIEGKFGEWRSEWKDTKELRRGGHPVDFWDMVQKVVSEPETLGIDGALEEKR